jgi:hypothetical protein
MTYPGYTEHRGVGMGDFGGYPETKLALVEGIDRLVASFREDATYYRIVEMDLRETVRLIKENLGGNDD